MSYKKIIRDNPPVPENLQKQYIASGDKTLIDRVILGYGAAVIKLARRYSKNRQDLEELFQLGMEGVVKGVANFDVTKENKVHTYLDYWIRVKMRRWAQDNRLIRVTNLAWKLLQQFRVIEENNPNLTVDQLIELLTLSPEREFMLRRALQKCDNYVKSYTEHKEEHGTVDFQPSKTDTLLLEFENQEAFDKTFAALEDKLSEKELEYIKLKIEGLSKKQICEILGMDTKEVNKLISVIRRILL